VADNAGDRRLELDSRDHRRLGPELDLFSFSEYSPGVPFWHPRGSILYNELVAFIREEWRRRGYLEVRAPVLLDAGLFRRSGHLPSFQSAMFFSESEGRELALKPMNCPGHCVLFAERPRSWRDLPIRYAEVSPLHRNEPSGSLLGLKRVRSFSQDDAHIFCREDQVEDEILGVISFLREVYPLLGFGDALDVELSQKPEGALGSEEVWARAEGVLHSALGRAGLSWRPSPGQGAFYGPKIDFHLRDALGRSWQCGTVQADFVQPERFGLEYRGKDNLSHRPVMVHRAVLGSFERLIGILVEQWQGDFPLWLAPEQVRVLPVSKAHVEGARGALSVLEGAGLRVSLDASPSRLEKRILEASRAKVPVIAVVGAREIAARSVSVRRRGVVEAVALDDLASKLMVEVRRRMR
jgi:threonyl-tRNA synthetase